MYNLVSFFEDVDDSEEYYIYHVVSFIWQTFFGPKKIGLVMDFAMIIGFLMAEQWGPMLYIAVPYIPAILIEFGLYTAMPQLDTPHIPFELWIDEIINGEPWFDSKVEERDEVREFNKE